MTPFKDLSDQFEFAELKKLHRVKTKKFSLNVPFFRFSLTFVRNKPKNFGYRNEISSRKRWPRRQKYQAQVDFHIFPASVVFALK